MGNIGENYHVSGSRSNFVKYRPDILMATSAKHEEHMLALLTGLHMCIKEISKGIPGGY